CNDNMNCQVVFFCGSEYPSIPYPGLFDTPYCIGSGSDIAPCQNESIISPVIDLGRYSANCDHDQDAAIPPGVLPDLCKTELCFTVYPDLPLANCVFYTWGVREVKDSCPQQWENRNYVYYGEEKRYIDQCFDITDLVAEYDTIQMSLTVLDMCDVWFGVYCNCATHTPAPWFDNVCIHRSVAIGPTWSYEDEDLFQDNFPSNPDLMESTIRADAALDSDPSGPNIIPEDCITVSCGSYCCPGGIKWTGDWPEVYMYVRCSYIGPGIKPVLAASQLADWIGCGRLAPVQPAPPWVAFQASPSPTGVDEFQFDLNDQLFTRGYFIEYYFEAEDACGKKTTLPARARALADATYPDGSGGQYKGVSYLFEFTCLPTMNSDILYVDDCHGLWSTNTVPGAAPWGYVEYDFNNAFISVIPSENLPDRYDVNAPEKMVSNGLGSRAYQEHLSYAYRKIIWSSGHLSHGTICDGSALSDKSPDCQVLNNWLLLTGNDIGLWITGDNIACDLDDLIFNGSIPATTLMGTWCGTSLDPAPNACSYYELTGGLIGGTVNPEITGTASSIFWVYPPGEPVQLFACNPCPNLMGFDVLQPIGNGISALRYPNFGGQQYSAAIQASSVNSLGYDARTMWFGFSYQRTSPLEVGVPLVKFVVLRDIIAWMENIPNEDITETDVPLVTRLAQNYPNPFNPATTIQYDLREKGPVTIRIYNVQGQIVRKLVDEIKKPGSYSIVWDGKNDSGAPMASGVYFYKMEAPSFSRTRKIVLLR
ncbi:MAG TPA: FlgD immunoglobulin-like domain containing protein, partial [Patescibacteria group bacterium]|nr:FlgD immunoglobulin-like domain containing protein [Patescibacteria group bacterium]